MHVLFTPRHSGKSIYSRYLRLYQRFCSMTTLSYQPSPFGMNRKSRRVLLSLHRRRKLHALPPSMFDAEDRRFCQMRWPNRWRTAK